MLAKQCNVIFKSNPSTYTHHEYLGYKGDGSMNLLLIFSQHGITISEYFSSNFCNFILTSTISLCGLSIRWVTYNFPFPNCQGRREGCSGGGSLMAQLPLRLNRESLKPKTHSKLTQSQMRASLCGPEELTACYRAMTTACSLPSSTTVTSLKL